MKANIFKNSPMFYKADLIIFLVVLIIGIVAMVIAFQPPGDIVEIRLDSKVIYRIPLSEDRVIELEDIGIIIVENNTVTMIESTCPDQLCVIQGRILRAGQSIICLPNRLVITIVGDDEWDVIV